MVLLLTLGITFKVCFRSADVTAVYTRNNLSWNNAEVLEDGSIELDLTNGETTISLENNVKGNIRYNLYLYTENEIANEVKLSAKNLTEANENEYPDSLKESYIKCAYHGYIKGNKKSFLKIESDNGGLYKLLIIIEDNNSYPKEEKNIPTIANVKFNAEVLLDGQYPRGNNYSFSLKDAQGEVIETVHNDDGYVSFSNIALKQKGTYVYYLSQNEGNDKETDYDKSVYKINVAVEEKNIANVSYEIDGISKETLPRFSNYKEIVNDQNSVEYPTNDKKANTKPNYLLISTLLVASLLVIFCIVAHKKKG